MYSLNEEKNTIRVYHIAIDDNFCHDACSFI